MKPLKSFLTAMKYLRDSNNSAWSKIAVAIIAAIEICYPLALGVLVVNALLGNPIGVTVS